MDGYFISIPEEEYLSLLRYKKNYELTELISNPVGFKCPSYATFKPSDRFKEKLKQDIEKDFIFRSETGKKEFSIEEIVYIIIQFYPPL